MTSLTAATFLPFGAHAYSAVEYAPNTWRELRDNDNKVILNFRASWSLTCQIKQDILTQLLQETPAYQNLTFLEVDWDTFGRSQWTERLKVKRRSTLIAMKGKNEIARVVNEPYARSLRRLLDAALAA
ncbi:MAG: thioredoxin family protein [Aliishimia sp.]